MDDLKIPKRRVPVEYSLPGGETRRVTVFLAEFAPGHAGREHLGDLLNGSGAFIPASVASTGVMSFVNRDAIAVARALTHDVEGQDEIPASHPLLSQHTVELTLLDGRALRGRIRYIRPTDRSRLYDYLQDAPHFIPLQGDGGVTMVNRKQVARVVILQEL